MKMSEQLWLESEKKRKLLAAKVEQTKKGAPVPGEAREALVEIERLRSLFSKEALSDVIAAKAFARLEKLLEVLQSRVEAQVELKEFSMEISDLTTTLNTIKTGIQGSHHMLVTLNTQLTAEFEERRKHRQLAQQTLMKLNKYLDNWQ